MSAAFDSAAEFQNSALQTALWGKYAWSEKLMASASFDLRALSNALPMTVDDQAEYNVLRQRVEQMKHGFPPTGDPVQQPGAEYYGVWAGRDIGVFSNWASCSEAVTGFAANGYKNFPTWTAAVDAVTEHLWLKQKRLSRAGFVAAPISTARPTTPSRGTSSVPSTATPSSVSASTRIALSPRTPSRSPATPTRAMPTPTPIVRVAASEPEYFVVRGKRSVSFFVDRAEAIGWASELEGRQELENFWCSTRLEDVLHTLASAAQETCDALD
ncbi:hypothetical protein C8F01DRAFT_1252749 [Mycena amicta]|nr:hypothetical protein C8F01DRAFT_1252749 [Mycena amicta]